MPIWSCIKLCKKKQKKNFHIFLYKGWDNPEIKLSWYFGNIKIKQVYGSPFYRNYPYMQIWMEEILIFFKSKRKKIQWQLSPITDFSFYLTFVIKYYF